MTKKWIWLVLALCLLAGGCAQTQPTDNPNTEPSTEETLQTETKETQAEPRVLDDNGDGVVTWYALGDSITQGYYSYLDENGEGKLGLRETQGWAQLVANSTGWHLTNAGVGGSGFVHNGTVLDKLNARDHVDSLNFRGAEVITLAYGVNDWKYNMKLGSMEDDIAKGGTFYSNMRYIVEKLQAQCPDAEIVVISPLNCSRYGTADTNWGLEFAFSQNGTLQDIFDALQEVCDHYSLPMVDILHNTEINNNIVNWLPDGVHPSLAKHGRLAQILEAELKKVLPEK